MPYTSEHGDIFILEDRNQLAFSENGGNFSITPNQWYTAGETLYAGQVVSIANQEWITARGSGTVGRVYATDSYNVDKTVGIVLNATVAAGSPVEVQSVGLYTWPNYYLIAVSGTVSGTCVINGITYSPTVGAISATQLANNIVTTYNANPQNRIKAYVAILNSLPYVALVGAPSNPTMTSTFTNATATLTPRFVTADIGNTAYVAPTPDGGLTTDRSLATSVSNQLVECGVIKDVNTIFIDFEGDSRGAANLSQISLLAGEIMSMSNTRPFLVAEVVATGKVVKADKLKINDKFRVVGWAVGSTTGWGSSIPVDASVVIQKLGVITDSGFSFTSLGEPVYLDSAGAYTQNASAINSYTDVLVPVGTAVAANMVYVKIEPYSYLWDQFPIGSIIAQPSTGPDYGWLTCNGSALNAVTNTQYQPLYDVVKNTWGGTNNTDFVLPPTTAVPMQIKYLSWYRADPMNSPLFRIDTGWTTWPQVPTGYTGTAGSYIDINVSVFGYDAPLDDLFVEIYATKSGTTHKVVAEPVVYTLVGAPSTYARYGYQITKTSANTVRVEFSPDGLAWMNTATGLYTAIDNTWQYKVYLYKTERYNKFYDYTADTKVNQLWALGLMDYANPYNVQMAGKLDRSTTNPAHTTRLNYDGWLYTYNQTVTNALNVTGLATISNGIISQNTTASVVPLTVTANASQSANIETIQKSGVANPYLIMNSSGQVAIGAGPTALAPIAGSILDLTGPSSHIWFNAAANTMTMTNNGDNVINMNGGSSAAFSVQISGVNAFRVTNDRSIHTGALTTSLGSVKLLEVTSETAGNGAALYLNSSDASIQGIISTSTTGLIIDSNVATTRSIDLKINGNTGFFLDASRNVGIGAFTTASPPRANGSSKTVDIRSFDNANGATMYFETSDGTTLRHFIDVQTTGMIIDAAVGATKQIDMRIGGASGLLIDANKYGNFSTRLGVGGTPANIFHVNTAGTTTNGIYFRSTGTVRAIDFYPLNAAGANNDIVQTNDSSIIFSDTTTGGSGCLVIAPYRGSGLKRGMRMDGAGSTSFWGLATFMDPAATASQPVNIQSGRVMINASGSGNSSGKFALATSATSELGSIGGYFTANSLVHYYMGTTSADPEFKVSQTTGNGTFKGTVSCSYLASNVGASGSLVTSVFTTNIGGSSDYVTNGYVTTMNSTTNVVAIVRPATNNTGEVGDANYYYANGYITTVRSTTHVVTNVYPSVNNAGEVGDPSLYYANSYITTMNSTTGNITNVVSTTVRPGTNNTGSVGTSSYYYSAGYITTVNASTVYAAVWNDIADHIPAKERVAPGYAVCRDKNYEVVKTSKYAQKGSLGIVSDTFGMALGKDENDPSIQLPVAVGGWALAHVDKLYPTGTPLVASAGGILTKAHWYTKLLRPEAILAKFDRPEPSPLWKGRVVTNGRNWVKVV